MWVAFANAKATHIFFKKNISVYAIFNDQSFNDTLTNDIISFKQLDHVKDAPGNKEQIKIQIKWSLGCNENFHMAAYEFAGPHKASKNKERRHNGPAAITQTKKKQNKVN